MDYVMTRAIINSEGEVIGTLTLPDETTEEQWSDALAHYLTPTPKPINEVVDERLQASMEFGLKMIRDAATENILTGITQAGKTREVSDFLSDVERYLRTGSLYAASDELSELAAGEIPEDIQTWVSQEKLLNAKSRIDAFLGL
jgi:hypothetical protein